MTDLVLVASWPVFIGVTVVLAGGCAIMTGRALAGTWRPAWPLIPSALALAAASRFLAYALFQQDLLNGPAYILDGSVLLALAVLSYAATRAAKMVGQYPWLYERQGIFSWRDKLPSGENGGYPPEG